MNDSIRLLFDECIGAPITEALAEYLKKTDPESHEIRHIREFYLLGTPDEQWLPDLAQKDFLIISGDRGKSSKGKKLPLICVTLKITHILLAPSIISMKSPEKARAIISLWPRIVEAKEADKGSRFLIYSGTSPNAMMRQIEITDEDRRIAERHARDLGFRLT